MVENYSNEFDKMLEAMRRDTLISVASRMWPHLTKEQVEEQLIEINVLKPIEPMFKTLEHEGPNLP